MCDQCNDTTRTKDQDLSTAKSKYPRQKQIRLLEKGDVSKLSDEHSMWVGSASCWVWVDSSVNAWLLNEQDYFQRILQTVKKTSNSARRYKVIGQGF